MRVCVSQLYAMCMCGYWLAMQNIFADNTKLFSRNYLQLQQEENILENNSNSRQHCLQRFCYAKLAEEEQEAAFVLKWSTRSNKKQIIYVCVMMYYIIYGIH